ncbi:hypothetical protein ADK34_32730 [Streptomyces viridochromogenes]|uniref:Uncharacterized protein n=1 Tax=Streptomyces viridochromogenes TaxID=1938 RepID=A0A0L8JEN0_STRVR|nr:hypothetical protein ADK34_32730 [Streptomyces viridochromogenes]
MRWLRLYARSRQIFLSLPATVISGIAAAIPSWSGEQHSPDARSLVLALSAGIAVASTGLGGQDVRLDRTGSLSWAWIRAAHALGIGMAAVTVLLALQVTTETTTLLVIGRAACGLAGLAAIGAAVFGAAFAWAVPFAWCAVAYFVPPSGDRTVEIAAWMFQPADAAPSTWMSAALLVTGLVTYATAGPRPSVLAR